MPRGTIQVPLRAFPGGTREDVSPVELPEGAYLASSNWLTRRGVGRPRPGYMMNLTLADGKRVLGIGIRGTLDQTDNLIFHTTDHAYYWNGTSVTDVTGTGYVVSTPDQPIRMTTFTQGGTTYLLAVNSANTVREWSNAPGNFMATAGSPPTGKDMTVAASRVVVVAANGFPNRIQWSEFKDRTTWLSTSLVELIDTKGTLVAARAFGPNTLGVYKDDAVYLGTTQAALQPFQFQFVAHVPGPISPASLVDALGVHYWIAEDYALYKFDGTFPKLVSAGLSRTIASNMSTTSKGQSHGFAFFSQDEREVWFFYPTTSGSFNAVSHNVISGAVNHHTLTDTISATMDWKMQGTATITSLDSDSSTISGLDTFSATITGLDGSGGTTRGILLGDVGGKVYTFGQAVDDNGQSFPWSFTHGWTVPGALQARVYVDGVSSLWKLTSASKTVSIGLEASDKIDDQEVEMTQTFDTSTDTQHLATFTQERGKFIRVRHSGTGAFSDLQFRGAILSAWPKGRV